MSSPSHHHDFPSNDKQMCRTAPTALSGDILDQVEGMFRERFRDGFIRQRYCQNTITNDQPSTSSSYLDAV